MMSELLTEIEESVRKKSQPTQLEIPTTPSETIKVREGYWKGKGKWIVKPDKEKGIEGVHGTGEYQKRRIKSIRKFCGWGTLKEYVEDSDYEIIQALRATTFETGGRALEVLSLKKSQFDFETAKEKGGIIISGMINLKHDPESDLAVRDVVIEMKDPLVPYMLEWLQYIKKENDLLFDQSYAWLYKYIVTKPNNTDPVGWFPHRLRAERAHQLMDEHRFRTFELLEWFGWARAETARKYLRLGPYELIDKMLEGKM